MTKVRPTDSFADAAMIVIATLGRARAAAVVERAEHHIYRWGDASPGGDRPNVEQALRLDIAMLKAGHEPPFVAAWRAQLAMIDAPQQAPADPKERLIAVMREVGEVAAEVARASADGRYSAGERAAIMKQLREARAEIDTMLREVGGAGPRGLVGEGA